MNFRTVFMICCLISVICIISPVEGEVNGGNLVVNTPYFISSPGNSDTRLLSLTNQGEVGISGISSHPNYTFTSVDGNVDIIPDSFTLSFDNITHYVDFKPHDGYYVKLIYSDSDPHGRVEQGPYSQYAIVRTGWRFPVCEPDSCTAYDMDYFVESGRVEKSLTISGIYPPVGIPTGSVTRNITGTNFLPGMSVHLIRTDQTPITATSVLISNNGTLATCVLPISSAATGDWNVQVLNSDGSSATLENGFTIVSPVLSYQFVKKWGLLNRGTDPDNYSGMGIAHDQSGNIYVTDPYTNSVVKFTSDGIPINSIGTHGTGDGEFRYPFGVAVDNAGNIYVADTFNNRIQKFNSAGEFISKFGTSGSDYGQFHTPMDVAIDNDGNIYVADSGNARVQKFNANGEIQLIFGTSGSDNGQFNSPQGIDVDGSGNIYVADVTGARVQKFNPYGIFLTKIVVPGLMEPLNPFDVAVDDLGFIYIGACGPQHSIHKFSPDGLLIAEFGDNYQTPTGITLDDSGNVFISDSPGYCVYKYRPGSSSDPIASTMSPDTIATGTNPFTVSSFSGSGFVTGGSVNKIQINNGNGYSFNHTVLGTVKEKSIMGTQFNLTGAPIGSYYIRMSKNFGLTWMSSPSPLLNITCSDPTLSGITPVSGPNTAPLIATINGTNFRTGATILLTNRTLTLPAVSPVITSTKITCSFPLTGAPPSIWNLTFQNTDGSNATLPNAFTITNATPVISKVSPTSGFNTVDTNLTITGSSFRNGITAHLICDNYTLPGINLVKTGTTQIQYTFPTTGQSAGMYNLTVTNIDGTNTTRQNFFELKSPSNNPNITSTVPWTGKNNAAIPITITGSNFRGQDSKMFTGISVTLTNETLGTTITGTPTSRKAQKSTTLYYTLLLTGKPAGIYNLTVRNYDGSFWTNTSGFIITTTDPTVSKISPTSGYTTKDQPVTLTGTNFRTGARITLTNGSISYHGSGVAIVSPTSLTCSFLFASDNFTDSGKYNVTVTNTDGTSGTLVNAFTVIAPANSPVISTITPVVGLNNAGKAVTISGSNFSKPTVAITNGTISRTATATTGKTQKSTTLYYTLPLTGLEPGSYLVKVTNSNGTSDVIPFTVNPTIPTITAISPVLGYTTGDTAVTITGTNYRDGATVELANGTDKYTASNPVVTSSRITCTVPTTGITARKYNLTVTNTDGTNITKPDSFTVYNPGTVPVIKGISPNTSTNAESKAVTIYGTDFRGTKANSFAGITVTLSNATTGTTVTGTPTPKKAHSSTRLYYTLPFSGVPAGVYDLKVVNADGQIATLSEAVTVTTTWPTIAIDAKTKKEKISPVTAFNTGNVSVTITGNNFREGVTANLMNGTEEIDGTVKTRLINQIITVFPLADKPAGSYNLTITNTDGTTVTAKTKFTITNPGTAAVITSVSPASSFNTGNQPVVISGKNFNKPTVYLNQDELTLLATATAKKTSTTTILYVTFPLKDVPGGLYNIIVRNSDGVNTTATDIFYVTEKAWVNSVQNSAVVQYNPRRPVMSVPQVARPAGSQATGVGPQALNSLVLVPQGPGIGSE